MTIFIISSSQKTRGQVTGNPVRLHATHIGIAHGIARCILLRTFIYALLVYLGAFQQRKERYFENVNKDQNCDRLNFIFL